MTTLTLEGKSLINGLLAEQAELSAVETFARRADDTDADAAPDQARYYRDLLPATAPGPGQQYAFQVDLDACSGCKACVSACHSMNGLDPGESWRDVGQLVGVAGPTENPLDDLIAGAAEQAVVQHVTTACHHCVDPGCLSGCPVKAYDKDPVTGIVRHLDDQCIGCQYCVFTCPYDVPKYNRKRGIVRKCDMCRERLAADEAPACVAACPTSAIAITLVHTADAARDAQARVALPGTPDPRHTQPTTRFVGTRPLGNAQPADEATPQPEHAHWPLILMLPLTQLAVGTLIAAVAIDQLAPGGLAPGPRLALTGFAALAGLVGLISSTLHLGRPLYAFRAVLGLRTSWLSREIVGFGAWFNTVLLYLGLLAWNPDAFHGQLRQALGLGVAATGLGAVFCSAMIYYATPRALWARWQTLAGFFVTTAALGAAAALAAAAWPGVLVPHTAALLALVVAGASLAQFALDATRTGPALAGTRRLLAGVLRPAADTAALCRVFGGIVLPLLIVLLARPGAPAAFPLAPFVVPCLLLTFAGALTTRWLFFTAVVPPKMPGQVGVRTGATP